jgi:hypothetical protein
MFLDEDRMEELWPDGDHPQTVFGAIRPLLAGTGDIRPPYVESINDRLGLLVGDLALSSSEDELNSQWPDCLDRNERAFRVISAFWRLIREAATERQAPLVLIDVGPNLGAINRAALLAAGHIVIPLAPDLYSLQGLKKLGPTLRRWRDEWTARKIRNPVADLSIPDGEMCPGGYVVLQHAVRLDRPVKADDRWMSRIPVVYREAVLGESACGLDLVQDDLNCLATIKRYRSLMPLAQEARKPMFLLRAADGAIGSHASAVQDCYRAFRALALKIASRCGVPLPNTPAGATA